MLTKWMKTQQKAPFPYMKPKTNQELIEYKVKGVKLPGCQPRKHLNATEAACNYVRGFLMGNLIGESETISVINCNETRHCNNRNQVKGHIIRKFSKSHSVILHQNIRGLNRSKHDKLSFPLAANPSHTICFTEHHLDINETDTIVLPNYRLGGKFCRNSFKNGGICIFTHESL